MSILLALPPDRGVDPGARDNEALHWAAHRCYTSVLRLLLLPRAVPVPPATLALLHNQATVRTVYTEARWEGAGLAHARAPLLALRLVARRCS